MLLRSGDEVGHCIRLFSLMFLEVKLPGESQCMRLGDIMHKKAFCHKSSSLGLVPGEEVARQKVDARYGI